MINYTLVKTDECSRVLGTIDIDEKIYDALINGNFLNCGTIGNVDNSINEKQSIVEQIKGLQKINKEYLDNKSCWSTEGEIQYRENAYAIVGLVKELTCLPY